MSQGTNESLTRSTRSFFFHPDDDVGGRSKSPLALSTSMNEQGSLTISFRGHTVEVTHPCISRELAKKAIHSEPFRTWLERCSSSSTKEQLVLENIEIQSIDMFGERVGFIKLESKCRLRDKHGVLHQQAVPGICLLRGNSVSILVALYCSDDDATYTILVNQPRVPIGQPSMLELPAGMLDGEGGVSDVAVQELKEECGIVVAEKDLVDLTKLANEARQSPDTGVSLPGICPSPGGCDEFVQCMYLEKTVSKQQVDELKGRLTGLRHEGELISLRIIPLNDVWKVCSDAKALCSLYLLQQLRNENKIPPLGTLATPLVSMEPTLTLANGLSIPQLAFGLYKVENSAKGERVVLDAIRAGYRHFDTAAFYKNESMLARALQKSGLPRQAFFITSKVWNDTQIKGREAVRQSVEEIVNDFGGYLDLFLVHWPVPGHFIDTYKELEVLHDEGKLRSLGLSNFSPKEYEELVESGIHVMPVVNQIEVSPVLFQEDVIDYFTSKGVLISAYKPLNRGACFYRPPLPSLATKYSKTPAQIMIRWGLQRGLIVVAKTNSRMKENRNVVDFMLTDDEMSSLDGLTTPEYNQEREESKLKFMRQAASKGL